MLRKAVEGLPAIYRNVVLLRDIEELDVRETAAALGITEGAERGELAPGAGVAATRTGAAAGRRFAPQTEGKTFGWLKA